MFNKIEPVRFQNLNKTVNFSHIPSISWHVDNVDEVPEISRGGEKILEDIL